MTPLGERLVALRTGRGMTQREMAEELGVSASYLSALERGRRGRAGFSLLQGVIALFGLIWDDADELMRLAALSDPKVRLDTSDMEPVATEVANLLAHHAARLERSDWEAVRRIVERAAREDEKVLGARPGDGAPEDAKDV